MTPDDLAVILKERKGINILKVNGEPYQHFNGEWRDVKNSLQNALECPWTNNIVEVQILNERMKSFRR